MSRRTTETPTVAQLYSSLQDLREQLEQQKNDLQDQFEEQLEQRTNDLQDQFEEQLEQRTNDLENEIEERKKETTSLTTRLVFAPLERRKS